MSQEPPSNPKRSGTVKEGLRTITIRGKPVMVLMAYDYYESLIETLDILSDCAFSKNLTKSIQQAREGSMKGSAEVRRRLGI